MNHEISIKSPMGTAKPTSQVQCSMISSAPRRLPPHISRPSSLVFHCPDLAIKTAHHSLSNNNELCLLHRLPSTIQALLSTMAPKSNPLKAIRKQVAQHQRLQAVSLSNRCTIDFSHLCNSLLLPDQASTTSRFKMPGTSIRCLLRRS